MRRLLTIAATITFFCVSSATAVNAASAGGKCSRQGSTSTSGSTLLVCAKVGNSLKWKRSTAPSRTNAGATMSAGASCTVEGTRVDSGGVTLECRRIAQGLKKYFQVSAAPGPITNPPSPESIANCRLPDLRSSNATGMSTVYPVKPANSAVTNRGVVNVGIIFVDFDGVDGSRTELNDQVADVKLAAEWIRWYSQGRVTYNLQFSDHWIRASRPEGDYRVFIDPTRSGRQIMTNAQITADFRSMAQTTLDLSAISVLWVVHPKAIRTIDESFVDRSQLLIINTARDTYGGGYPTWQNFIHETVHQHGLLGHAPKREQSLLGVMSMNGSPGTALNTWDSIVLDWMREDNLYCVHSDRLAKVALTLVPQEREQEGLRAAFIRLSESEALIIESHRRDKWSPRWPAGLYGVTVMRVDSRLDTVFNDGSSTTKYLMEDKKQFMMVEGESLTTDGIKIALVKSGDNDTVSIERIG